MLPLEFHGTLFQLDAREPQFAAVSPQLPPKIAACMFPINLHSSRS